MICSKCGAKWDDGSIFCPQCGQVSDLDALKGQTVVGFHGPASLSPSVEKFWHSGDPSVFAKPGAMDYNPA